MNDNLFDLIYLELQKSIENKPIKNEPLLKHTSFKVGGKSKLYLVAEKLKELKTILEITAKHKADFFIIGRGTNILVSDKGYDGLVIELGQEFKDIIIDDNYIKAGSSARLPTLVRSAYEHNLEGLAFATGIPGSVGGALVMNAGTKSGEVGMLVKNITIMNKEYNLEILSQGQSGFGYRSSGIKKKGIIVEADFILKHGKKDEIKWEMERNFMNRKQTQPLNQPSAGCVFKNPSKEVGAGYLIEKAGCKGLRVGGAEVSKLHGNYIINNGRASAADIYKLISLVKEKVFQETDQLLIEEIEFLGDFDENI